MKKGLIWSYDEVEYLLGKKLQKKAKEILKNKSLSGILILLSHPPVYTIGRGGGLNNFKIELNEIKKIAEIYEVERGGNVTFHGPGQLVIYPIFALREDKFDIGNLVYNLEEVVIRVLKDFNIIGERKRKYPGVWVKDEKICALGLSIHHFITSHGLALNINTDLSYFDNIVPCGIKEYGVTSLEKLGIKIDINVVKQKIIEKMEEIFNIEFYFENKSIEV